MNNFDLNYAQELIDWNLLSKACIFYSNCGYTQIEVPWFTEEKYSNYTKPHNENSFILSNGIFQNNKHELIGSAEVGFIYLLENNKLENKKYFSVSPCFRSDTIDKFHQKYFIKLELFYPQIGFNNKTVSNNFIEVLNDSFLFFNSQTKNSCEVISVSDDQDDILLNKIEIGSYGKRVINGKSFIYGTGLALPRFSLSKEKK